MSRAKQKVAAALIISGCICLLAAVLLIAYNAAESSRASKTARELTAAFERLLNESVYEEGAKGQSDPALEKAPSGEYGEVQTLSVGGYDIAGRLELPSIGLDIAVIAEWSYANLSVAPCRYSGTPGERLVLLAHNYDRHFGRLTELEPGDEATFTDVSGEAYSYEVLRTEIWTAEELEQILSGEDWGLTLFTCTYGGAKRVVVRCAPAG